MRLSALSRKIDKTPKQLTEFLEKHGITVDKGLHTKLDHAATDLVFSHFLPERLADEVVEEVTESEEPTTLTPEAEEETSEIKTAATEPQTELSGQILQNEEVIVDPVLVTEAKAEFSDMSSTEVSETKTSQEPKTGTIDDMENESFEEVELIKAKKVKLEGFKVVGKIDLPEKPEKTVKEENEATATDGAEKQDELPTTNKQHFGRERKKKRGARLRNPLSYEERLKREEQAKKREQKKKLKEDKLRRKKQYEATHQNKVTVKTKKKKHKKSSQKAQYTATPAPHKNPVLRFWNWLNGKYDRF